MVNDRPTEGRAAWTTGWKVAVGALVGTLAAGLAVATDVLSLSDQLNSRFGEPIEVAAEQILNDTCVGWVFPGDPSALGDIPAVEGPDPEARPRWAIENGAINAYSSIVSISIRGTTPRAIEITGLQVHVVDRKPAISGTHVAEQCGDAIDNRYFSADLSVDNPEVLSLDERLEVEPYGSEPQDPLAFGYEVDASDLERFVLVVQAPDCYCTWVGQISWRDGTHSGYTLITDAGQPFEVTGIRSSVQVGNYEGGPLAD